MAENPFENVTNVSSSETLVLPAIHFDDEKLFATNEIADIAADRLLPYELVPIDLSVTNPIPKTVSASV